MCEKINAFGEKNLSLSDSSEVGTFGYLKLLDFKEKKKALNMRKKGEAEIEKGPVGLRFTSVRAIPTSPGRRAPFFPPNRPTKRFIARRP